VHRYLPRSSAGRFNQWLAAARTLTVEPPVVFLPRLASLLSEAGVVFMLVPAIPRSHVSGVARWIGPRPMIQLSLYGKTNDRFWFTFFHEAAHVLLHARDNIFLDDSDGLRVESHFESEADQWAADMLIPRRLVDELRSLRSGAAVRSLAAKANNHPEIVVGRLQHDGKLKHFHLNALKVPMEVQGTKQGKEHHMPRSKAKTSVG
jgi:HTH-type transcriptional regulator/antitoxin HigA